MKKVPKLTAQERDLIAIWYEKGISIRRIAKRLKRYPSIISREIKRNIFFDKYSKREYYVAICAQVKTLEKKVKAGKRHPLKNPVIYSYVLKKLGLGWSPEQIAGRLKKKYGKKVICHETIYSFIYAKENKERNLWEKLPSKQKKRKK